MEDDSLYSQYFLSVSLLWETAGDIANTTVEGCNGEAAAVGVGDGLWNSTFIANDGDEYDIDVFYATYDDELWVRTLQVKYFNNATSTRT